MIQLSNTLTEIQVESTTEWNQMRDELANSMWSIVCFYVAFPNLIWLILPKIVIKITSVT